MSNHPTKYLLLPLLALSLCAFAPAQVRADEDHVSTSFHVSFGTTPHWSAVRGTRVMEIRDTDRPDYDVFRYGSSYYVYNEGHWYRSRHRQGDYRVIDERYVPRDFKRIPREHWHHYPDRWDHAGDHRQH